MGHEKGQESGGGARTDHWNGWSCRSSAAGGENAKKCVLEREPVVRETLPEVAADGGALLLLSIALFAVKRIKNEHRD